MKTCCGLALVASLMVVGCGKETPPSAPPPPPAAAPAASGGYLGTMVAGQQKAVKVIDQTALDEDVKLFNVQEGRYPKDLNELVTKQYLGALPKPPVGMKFNYDPVAGKVTVIPE